MDFLNQGYSRLVDLFKSMTPGARITAALLLAVVVISLAYLVNHSAGGPDAYLMGGEAFTTQLPSMEAAFAKAGLNDYQIDGNRIRVPSGKQSVYMGALADAGALPATFGKYLAQVADSNPWKSNQQRREAMKIANQAELALIISHMQGIQTAAVMYDVEESKQFGKESVKTASVNVKPQGSMQLDENQIRMIRACVASAIAGLKPDQVTVTDLNGRTYPGTAPGAPGEGSNSDYATRKREYEKEWADKITKTLSYIPGVVVTSNVELDIETQHEESQTDYDPKSVPFQQHESTINKIIRGPSTTGRPGLQTNQNSNTAAQVSTSSPAETQEENTQTETQNAVGTRMKRVVQTGLTPKRVQVAVIIPSSYYVEVWREQNPAPVGQEAKKPDTNALAEIENKVNAKVQMSVNTLLPSTGLADGLPRVIVSSFQHLPSAMPPVPTMQDKTLDWVGRYWSTLGMIGLALVSLIMLRSMVRQAPAPTTAAASFDVVSSPVEMAGTIESGATGTRDSEPQTARNRLRRRSPNGPSLRDELSELVKEDPDSAVSVLRSWIGNNTN